MRNARKLIPSLLLIALGGCATLPPGPGVTVLPSQGKSFETFRTEDATCRQWAEQSSGMPTQEAYDRNVATGAVAGTAIGTGLGAALGAASGHTAAGALFGAASGLLIGSAVGSGSAEVGETQRRYDAAYVQCMYTYGNQVPGYRQVAVAAPPPAPAPPPVVTAPPSPVAAPEPEDYPPPPEVYVEDAPRFIYSPDLRVYVAVGVPYDLVYTGSEYYYSYGGRWYRGAYYNGPWAYVPWRSYPPVLSRYRVNHIRRYRDAEFRRFEHDRDHYDGRFYRPEFRGERRRM